MKLKILVLITLLLLSGCSKSPDSEIQEITYPPADTKGINVTYINTKNGLVPICYTKDGKISLSGENYYYNLKNIISSEQSLKDKAYTYFSHTGKNLGSVNYSELESKLLCNTPCSALITSSNWQLSPTLRYESVKDSKKTAIEYRQFLTDTYPERFEDIDSVNITDIWEYDLDGDSANEAILKAKDENGIILYLMSPTLSNCVLEETGSDFTATPFIADLDGNGKFSLLTVTGDNFKYVTVYKENSMECEYMVYLPIE